MAWNPASDRPALLKPIICRIASAWYRSGAANRRRRTRPHGGVGQDFGVKIVKTYYAKFQRLAGEWVLIDA